MKLKKFTLVCVLGALSAALGAAESFFPAGIVPGGKIGLSNIAIITVLGLYSYKEAFFAALFKSAAVLLAGGSVTGFLYSFSGTMAALSAMSLAMKFKGVSCVGAGIMGAFFNNLTQTVLASLIASNVHIMYYIGFLGPLSVITGAFTGFTGGLCIKYLKKKEILYV